MGRSLLEADTGKHAADTSFWVPQLTPASKEVVAKPDETVRCPFSNAPLKLKQLYPVKFHRADDSGGPDVAKSASERYMCPLTQKARANMLPLRRDLLCVSCASSSMQCQLARATMRM